MKKKGIIAVMMTFAACCLLSCNEYTDDLQGLGQRVEILEDSTLGFTNRIETIQKLLEARNTYGIISEIVYNDDGTCTLNFSDGREPITFKNGIDGANGVDGIDGIDGKDGINAASMLGVEQDSDGKYYWTFNGTWLLDANGNKVCAEPTDGKDGKDGVDGKDGKNADPVTDTIVLPQIRINGNGIWEISNDGGKTWTDTGVSADGQNGANGEDGSPDPVFIRTTVTDTEVIFIIHLNKKITTLVIPRL